MSVKGYTEPKSLVEDKESLTSLRHKFALLVLLIFMVLGAFCAQRLGDLAPTFNGNVDVNRLEEDPTDYSLDEADGAAYVIVSENLDLTEAKNVCFSVVFNFRGYDTMGESFILIAALAGALCILRNSKTRAEEIAEQSKSKEQRIAEAAAAAAEEERREAEAEAKRTQKRALSIIVRFTANLFLPLACTFGGYVVLHGDSSPGGGFQGGVLIASAVLLVFLAYGGKSLGKVFKYDFLHQTETIAEVIYIAIGLIGVLVGLNFAVNFVVEQLHFETAIVMNDAVGYHVMAGVGCLLIMLLGMMNVESDAAVHVHNPNMVDQPLHENFQDRKGDR